MDTRGFLEHVTLLEIAISLLVGIQVGAIYAWSQRLGTHFYHSAVISANFFIAILVASAIVEQYEWMEWIGIWGLWLIFQVGITVGYKLRAVYTSRKASRQ